MPSSDYKSKSRSKESPDNSKEKKSNCDSPRLKSLNIQI